MIHGTLETIDGRGVRVRAAGERGEIDRMSDDERRLDEIRTRGALVQLIDQTAAAGVRIIEIDFRGEDRFAHRVGVLVHVDVDVAVLQDHIAQAQTRHRRPSASAETASKCSWQQLEDKLRR